MGLFLVNDLQTDPPQKEPMVRYFFHTFQTILRRKTKFVKKKKWKNIRKIFEKNYFRKKIFSYFLENSEMSFWAYFSDDIQTIFFLRKILFWKNDRKFFEFYFCKILFFYGIEDPSRNGLALNGISVRNSTIFIKYFFSFNFFFRPEMIWNVC